MRTSINTKASKEKSKFCDIFISIITTPYSQDPIPLANYYYYYLVIHIPNITPYSKHQQ